MAASIDDVTDTLQRATFREHQTPHIPAFRPRRWQPSLAVLAGSALSREAGSTLWWYPCLPGATWAAPGETANSSYLGATYPAILPTASWETAWGSFELLLHPSVVFPPLRSVTPSERVSVQSVLQQWLV